MFKSREEYEIIVKKIIWKDSCPFCNIEWQWKCVIWKGEYWFIQHNMYPYLWLKEHIMAIPYSHKAFTSELSPEEFAEMSEVQKNIKKFYWDNEYFSFMRETLWNRSVEHLHYHYLPWVLNASKIENLLREQGF